MCRVILALLFALSVAICPAPAWAGSAWTDAEKTSDGVTAVVRRQTPTPLPRRSSSRRCTYKREAAPPQSLFDLGVFDPPPPGEGGWFTVTCSGSSPGDYRFDYRFVRFRPQADPQDLLEEARRELPLPAPQISTSPPPQFDSVVNLPVFLWIPADEWRPRSATADVPGVSVTVTAVPDRIVWDMGTGDQVVCRGPGEPWVRGLSDEAQPSTCRYVYRHTSAGQPGQRYQLTATVYWRATWSVAGAPGGGDLGEVARSATTSLRVAQVQTLNVN